MKSKKEKNNKIQYSVTLANDFIEPYFYEKEDNIYRKRTIETNITTDEKTFYAILDGILDAPKKKLSNKDIHKDFDVNRKSPISEDKVETIKRYYNGRHDLSKEMYAKLKKIDFSKIDENHPYVLKYNIPFELNYFSCDESNEYDSRVKMIDAYILIEISIVKQ